jgi:hypothetical protein
MRQARIDAAGFKQILLDCPKGHGRMVLSPEHPNRDEILANPRCPRCGKQLLRILKS